MEFFVLLAIVYVFFFVEMWLYGKFGLKYIKYKTSFSRKEIFEGESLFFDEEIYNKKVLAIPIVKSEVSCSMHLEIAQNNSSIHDGIRHISSVFYLRGFQKPKDNGQ